MQTQLIKKYTQSHLAHIHKDVLEENGIKAFVFGENFMSTVPNLSGILDAGIELRVHKNDYEKATKILGKELIDVITCENCNSENIEFTYGKQGVGKVLFSLFSAVAGEPFGNIERHYYCKDCGFKTQD
ncbi:MAG: DUF2007 domain-containing protein [Moheibacter sp.]